MRNFYQTFSKVFITFLSFFIILIYIFNSSLFVLQIKETLKIWFEKIVPSFIVMYFISTLLISFQAIDIIFIVFYPLRKLIKFETNNALKLFLISIFVGNPTSITNIIDFYENNYICRNDYIILLKTSSFVNPLFIFNILNNKSLFVLIYSIHILSNFIYAYYLTRNNNFVKTDNKNIKIDFFTNLNKLPLIVLMIGIYMVLATIIIFTLERLNVNSLYLSFIEISYGSNYIINLDTLNIFIKLCLFVSLLTFNGFCIHMQILSIINKYKTYRFFLIGRIMCTFISILLILIYFLIYT